MAGKKIGKKRDPKAAAGHGAAARGTDSLGQLTGVSGRTRARRRPASSAEPRPQASLLRAGPDDEAKNALNAAVAEYVMGWVRNKHNKLWPDKKSFGYRNSRGHAIFPNFDADINTAWSVVEFLAQKGLRLEHLGQADAASPEAAFSCFFADKKGNSFQGLGSTAPLAICRAALRARGKDPEKFPRASS